MAKQFCLLTEAQREKIDRFVSRCVKEGLFNSEVEALRVITPFYYSETLTEQHFELPIEQLGEMFGESIGKVRSQMKSEQSFNFDLFKKGVAEEPKHGGLF